ncbi:histidine kinase [Arthrobacter sp. AOP36-A1-22]|uniref:histidine kinase n=1 Tax=Arthrobacter sp. AOP36-A1-22 TaxID=3457684 RepID=UPI00403431C2
MTTTELSAPERSRLRRAWSGVWRMLVVVFFGLVGFIVVYATVFELDPSGPAGAAFTGFILLDLLMGLACFLLYPFRHRAPRTITALLVVFGAFSALGSVAAMMGIVSLATRRRWGEITFVSVLFLTSSLVAESVMPVLPDEEAAPWWILALLGTVFTAVLVLTGMYIGGRRQLRAALEAELASNRRSQQAQLEQARANERTRIAREMHDVLAHRLSLVALHAGALEYRTDLPPEQVSEAAGIIRANAHLAVSELREVLGVLRDPATVSNEPHSTTPPPTLGRLEALLAESREAGTPTVLEGNPPSATELEGLDDTSSRTVFRVLQEGLTNARKHAPAQTVYVRLAGRAGERLTVSLRNAVTDRMPAVGRDAGAAGPRAAPVSGMGLTGLSERIRLAGGSLSAADDGNGHFVVEAWVPWNR